MFKLLWMSEYMVNYELSSYNLLQSLFFLSISTSTLIFPVALFLSTFSTYNHLSLNFEITALRSIGFNLFQIIFPGLVFGLIFLPFSLKFSLYLSPLAHQKMERLMETLKRKKNNFKISSGVFTEMVPGILIYANKVDKKKGSMKQVFIYDESQSLNHLTVLAKKAQIKKNHEGEFFLQLSQGQIHKIFKDSHTKLDFKYYDFYIEPKKRKSFSLLAYNVDQIKEELKKKDLSKKRKKRLEIAYHRLWSFPFTGFLFCLLGMTLGTFYIRPFKFSGFVLCSLIISIYWAVYISFENIAKYTNFPATPLVWGANFIFIFPLYWSLRRLKI